MSSEIVTDIFKERLNEIAFIQFERESVLSKGSCNARKIANDSWNMDREKMYIINDNMIITYIMRR